MKRSENAPSSPAILLKRVVSSVIGLRSTILDVGLRLRRALLAFGRIRESAASGRRAVRGIPRTRGRGGASTRRRSRTCAAARRSGSRPGRCSPSLPTSMPASICASTTWRTALSISSAIALASSALPSSCAISRSDSFSLRGRLPTWVVRMRSRLRIMASTPERMVAVADIAAVGPACIIARRYTRYSAGDANDCCGRSARATLRRPPAVGAIPRHYNFAADILDRNLKAGRADKPAFIDPRGTWTYGQLADRVARFAAVLRALGVRREERVLIALLDTIDWPTAFLGCLKAGVVAVPVNTLMTEDDYRFMLADSRARVLVVSEALYPRFAEADRRKRRPRARHRLGRQRARPQALRGSDRRRDGRRRTTAPTVARRHRVLALHLGLDRQAEGRGACPRRSEAHRRSLRRRRVSASPRTTSAIRWRSCSSPMGSATR